MPQKRRWLNGLAVLSRRVRVRLRPAPGEPLSPQAFLAHAERLARASPAPPPRLALSLLVDAAPSWLARRRAAPWAEFVVGDARLADDATRWNDAAARARAPYVARLDIKGRVSPQALARIAAALAAGEKTWLLYTDAIETGASGRLREVSLKPAFDPVLLESFDYIGRLAIYARERLLALGGWGGGEARSGPDPAALDWALALRFARAAPAAAIRHLPYPAYVGPPSSAAVVAAEATLRSHLRASGRDFGLATPLRPDRLRPALRLEEAPWAGISVIIPSRDAPDLIGQALEGLTRLTDYPDLEIVVVDNGSSDPATLALYESFQARFPAFRVERKDEPFNFSRAVNRGAALSTRPYLLLLNNDVAIAEPGWLKEMASCFAYPDVGVVGAKLLYPDGTLQHAGVIAGLGGYAGHWHIGEPGDAPGPQRRLAARQSVSVVTAACMLVSRECFRRVGGFDEAAFPVAYNDVDFCLRAGALGFRTIWTPFARLVHHESATRGSDETEANRERFARDKATLAARHSTQTLDDRAYNPWAARAHSDPFPTLRATLPEPRR